MKYQLNIANVAQLLKMIPTESKTTQWLEKVRWSGKPVCPHCGYSENIGKQKVKKNSYWCRNCKRDFTVTTNTVMHGTKTPVRNWIIAMYYLMVSHKGVNGLQLAKELGVQHRTAWFMLQRIHKAYKESNYRSNWSAFKLNEED